MLRFLANGLVITSLVVCTYLLYDHMKAAGRKFAWWKWALTAIWVLGTYITFAFIGTTIGERELGATLRGGGAFLVVVLVSGLLIFRFCFLESKGGKVDKKELVVKAD